MKNIITSGLLAITLAPVALAADNAHHFPGIFVGATHADSQTELTLGIEYEYKFNDIFGIGGLYEKTNNAHHGDGVSVKLASLYYHPNKHWRFGLGAGEERIGGDHPHTETLYRISAAYDIHFNEFGLAPTFAVDFIDDDEAYVFGISITRPF